MLTEDEVKLKEALEEILPIVDRLKNAGVGSDDEFVPAALVAISYGAEDFLSYVKEHEPKPKRIKLVDYLDNPELIQHFTGRKVKALSLWGERADLCPNVVKVTFIDGEVIGYPIAYNEQFELIEPKMVEPIPETEAPEQKPDKVQVPVNLFEYINRPELVRHVNGRLIESISYRPEENDGFPLLVGFKSEKGKQTPSPTWYPKDTKKFVLIKPGTRVVGWRRKVLFKNGNIMATALFMPTKEAFSAAWKGYKTFGEWEKIDEIIEE
jgi:hypothetical protein